MKKSILLYLFANMPTVIRKSIKNRELLESLALDYVEVVRAADPIEKAQKALRTKRLDELEKEYQQGIAAMYQAELEKLKKDEKPNLTELDNRFMLEWTNAAEYRLEQNDYNTLLSSLMNEAIDVKIKTVYKLNQVPKDVDFDTMYLLAELKAHAK